MSLSFDTSLIMSSASQWFNSLMPMFAWPIGIVLGLGLIGYVIKEIRGALPH